MAKPPVPTPRIDKALERSDAATTEAKAAAAAATAAADAASAAMTRANASMGVANAARTTATELKTEVAAMPAAPVLPREIRLTGDTNVNGELALVFNPPFAAPPDIFPVLSATTRQGLRFGLKVAATASGAILVVKEDRKALLSLLGLDILVAGGQAAAGVTVIVRVREAG
jgi:hypothetical protein